jgi:hypothetical protein
VLQVVGGRNDCVVEVEAVDGESGYAVVVVEAVDMEFDRASLHAYGPTNKEYQGSLCVDVLSMSFDMLDCSLPSQDGLLFLLEPLNFLLNSS